MSNLARKLMREDEEENYDEYVEMGNVDLTGNICDECGVEKERVDEPMISGFRGYLCVNEACPVDS